MIIALVSKKGGVGKTTTAVNLAAAVVRSGRSALVVDLDSQASASLSLGVRRADLGPSVADVLLSGEPVSGVVRRTATPGLELVTASVDLVRADAELGRFERPTVRLAHALEPVAGRYDFIFLDCPPSLTLLPASAMAAADGFLVPVVPHFLALAGVQNLLSYAERVVRPRGGSPSLVGIVLTLADYRTRATRDNIDQLRCEFGPRVFGVEIRTNVRLAEAPASGKTIFEYDPASTGARAYELLGEEFLLRVEKGAAAVVREAW